ncbi:MAG: adenylyl-sulfate reductase subunit alpha [Nitrospinae bacterium]|nr:adenylyl-sulfate reductase subunit alpha [Nitrospinota bacterium]
MTEFKHHPKPEIVEVDTDILLIGGGMSACGAAYEAVRWGNQAKMRITMVDKAATDRSGAVAQGLSAINTYLGEHSPEDYVKYVRNDLMGIIREDLVYDLGRHVDDSVHLFEDWGLPVWKTDAEGKGHDGSYKGVPLREGGKPVRSGKWQIMINGESYKVLVAEAAKKALEENRKITGEAQNLFERVFLVKLLMDPKEENRVTGAVGFSVRENKVYIFRANAVLSATGGCVNIFKTRSVGEGQGRAWFPVWNAGSNYAMMAQAGAELTMMENRFVPARFKDGYGPVGAWFLLFKAQALNALGEDYCVTRLDEARKLYGKWADKLGTCVRNHMMMLDMKDGKGPIFMNTHTAMARLAQTMNPKEIKHLEAEAWEDFLDMTISQAGVWAANDIEPDKKPSEIMPSEPYLLGSHAGCAGVWVSGPADFAPKEWCWGYDRMTTVSGLFTAGDGVGASGHKFSSGSHAEGRIAGKAMVRWVLDHKDYKPSHDQSADELAYEIFKPMETYAEHCKYTTAPDVNPEYVKPNMFQLRLQKIMDEYVGGITPWYMTSKTMLDEGLRQLVLLKEDSKKLAAADLHELLRAWENYHRLWAAEAHARHILFREETRYPGYYYRGDYPKLDDDSWRCFVNSKVDVKTGEWKVFKREYKQLVQDVDSHHGHTGR